MNPTDSPKIHIYPLFVPWENTILWAHSAPKFRRLSWQREPIWIHVWPAHCQNGSLTWRLEMYKVLRKMSEKFLSFHKTIFLICFFFSFRCLVATRPCTFSQWIRTAFVHGGAACAPEFPMHKEKAILYTSKTVHLQTESVILIRALLLNLLVSDVKMEGNICGHRI